MMRIALMLSVLALCAPAALRAETVIAAGTIRGQSLIMPTDIALVPGETPGALSDPQDAIGMEAAVNLYAGRPIRPGDLRQPAIIERNSLVTIRFAHGQLMIIAEGRAMDRAAAGEALRVMNLSSRTTVTATAAAPGLVTVGQ
jgi:flagellar basal body P-ring formation protein FlgA